MAQKTNSAVLIGAAFIAVWGVELIHSIFGTLNMPHHSLLSSGVIRDYEEYVTGWLVVRALISSAGVVAGVLILRHKRLGYWLGATTALILLVFAVDYGWYTSLATGKLPPRFFLVTAPGLGYGVIVFPLLVASSLALSVINLAKGHRSVSVRESAI